MSTGEAFLNCGSCRFWDHKSRLTGVCRRHAPASGERDHEVVRWPETRPADGCGEGEMMVVKTEAVAPLGPSCKECLFWLRPGVGIDPAQRGDHLRAWWMDAGYCRRFAPRPGLAIGGRAFFGITHATDYCFDGRHR